MPTPTNLEKTKPRTAKPKAKNLFPHLQNHLKDDTVCFVSSGREICVPAAELAKLFSGRTREVSPWTIFRIMAEFINGFEFLKRYKKAVSIMGSARPNLQNGVYQEARELAFKLSKAGFVVITGGGPGIMEAANKGAYEAGGRSAGINIKLPSEQRTNAYVKESESFDFFFTRKVMLEFASQLYVFFPGGFGTLDEMFEMVTLIQTKKIAPVPIILVNKTFWQPLLDWIKNTIYGQNKAIDEKDMEIYHLVDSAEEAYEVIKELTKKKHLFN
ncbi:MAG: TIGR00730 family Rossman fold protein [Patescibacteria group bacterium]|nr:TIGR00730 family Rossman fold protein [Patescibacteria group bacterium]